MAGLRKFLLTKSHGNHECPCKKPMMSIYAWSSPALSRVLWYKRQKGLRECVFVADFYVFPYWFGVVKKSPGYIDFFLYKLLKTSSNGKEEYCTEPWAMRDCCLCLGSKGGGGSWSWFAELSRETSSFQAVIRSIDTKTFQWLHLSYS